MTMMKKRKKKQKRKIKIKKYQIKYHMLYQYYFMDVRMSKSITEL